MEALKIERWLTIVENSGYGYGYGSGDGYGDGYGYGSGDGYGYGYGSGDGYGDGYGSGSGDGLKMFNDMRIFKIDGVQTIITHIKGNVAKGFILKNDFTLEACYIVKGNNCFAHGETLRKAQEALEEKLFEDLDVEERISMFIKKFKLGKEYLAKDFYSWHNKLTGSCEMGRKAFAKDHDINLESDVMTVVEFIDLTKDAFGGSVIRQLAEELKIKL